MVSCGKNEIDSTKNSIVIIPNKIPNKVPTTKTCRFDTSILKGSTGNWNFLGFENFGFRGIGRCRGHAIISQKFSELASFSPAGECSISSYNFKCQREIDIGINKIINFQTHTFRGFSSLYEFSTNAYVRVKLKNIISGISHRFSAISANIRDYNPSNKQTSIFNEIILRIKENQQPYIGIKGEGIGHHAIIGYSLDYIDGSEVICIRDSNFIQRISGEVCNNYLKLELNKVYYQRNNLPLSKLFIFALTSDEDIRVKRYIKAQYNNCQNSN
jgi:hypothetical protein